MADAIVMFLIEKLTRLLEERARLLASVKNDEEWSGIEDHVNWYLGRDNTLKDTLRLSYHNLPARLKPCFLYFGMYPEGYEIPVKQLIRLWISEGFLIQETHKTLNTPELEYIAKGYLNELVDRSLIQVVSGSNDGGVKTCKIHNLLHDLCITESRDDKFSEVWGTEIDSQTHTSCPRRLSLQVTKPALPKPSLEAKNDWHY
ncbi:putative late blight resistance protein-like R1B-12 [Spatholobus suberectus]|nr:putative late blight resistance protein-like R1B-12 [Spatholobus suberectus]